MNVPRSVAPLIRWSPRVSRAHIFRLYEQVATGIQDDLPREMVKFIKREMKKCAS